MDKISKVNVLLRSLQHEYNNDVAHEFNLLMKELEGKISFKTKCKIYNIAVYGFIYNIGDDFVRFSQVVDSPFLEKGIAIEIIEEVIG